MFHEHTCSTAPLLGGRRSGLEAKFGPSASHRDPAQLLQFVLGLSLCTQHISEKCHPKHGGPSPLTVNLSVLCSVKRKLAVARDVICSYKRAAKMQTD